MDTAWVEGNRKSIQHDQDKPYPFHHPVAKFDLTLSIQADRDNYHGLFEYSKKLFKKSRIEVLSNDYLHILSAILEQPSILIEHIGLSGSNEEEELFFLIAAAQSDMFD